MGCSPGRIRPRTQGSDVGISLREVYMVAMVAVVAAAVTAVAVVAVVAVVVVVKF